MVEFLFGGRGLEVIGETFDELHDAWVTRSLATLQVGVPTGDERASELESASDLQLMLFWLGFFLLKQDEWLIWVPS